MNAAGFRLTHLTLKGPGAPNAEVQFDSGLNVIVGASNTGKTYVAQCVDFMFGGSRRNVSTTLRHEPNQFSERPRLFPPAWAD